MGKGAEERRVRVENTITSNELINFEKQYNFFLKSFIVSFLFGQTSRSTMEAATSLQTSCETIVRTDDKMRDYAKKAFLSFVRGYHSYPTHMRHIFPIKQLHLGHIAKSLALQDSPAVLGTYRPSSNNQPGQKFTAVKNASRDR